jgi:hypothetical protein
LAAVFNNFFPRHHTRTPSRRTNRYRAAGFRAIREKEFRPVDETAPARLTATE